MCTPDLLDQRLAIAEGRCQSYCQLPDPNGFPKVSENQECRYRRLDRSIQLYSFLHLPICAFEMVFTQRCRSETPGADLVGGFARRRRIRRKFGKGSPASSFWQAREGGGEAVRTRGRPSEATETRPSRFWRERVCEKPKYENLKSEGGGLTRGPADFGDNRTWCERGDGGPVAG